MNNCKLFTVTNQGVKEIDPALVKVRFENGKPYYELKEGDKNQIIVQSLNSKFASAKMLTIIQSRKNVK